MTGDCHVRFSERPGAKLPRATHLDAHAGIRAGAASNGGPYRDPGLSGSAASSDYVRVDVWCGV